MLFFLVFHLLRTTDGHSKPLTNADERRYAGWLAGWLAGRVAEFSQEETMTSAEMNVLQLFEWMLPCLFY